MNYPKPPGDTGLGIHLSAANTYPMGEHSSAYGEWIAELKALGMKWGKLVVGGTNGMEAVTALVAAGIMPIVRFYEGRQSPDALVDRQPELGRYVRDYVAAGVKYFEVSNEPNLFDEWRGGWAGDGSSEWEQGAIPDRVAQAWARDAQVVIDNGGLPGTPALSPGGHYSDVDFFHTFCLWLKQNGYAPLMQRGVWIAIHNGTLNHPLDYPGDTVNQTGVAVSQEYYDAHVWAGSREWVNAERVRGKNPGQTLHSVNAEGKDTGGSNCWDKFITYETIFENMYGYQIPVLGTEGGVWVGEKVYNDEPYNGVRIADPRYPAVSIEMQRDWTIEICRKMMAGAFPDYYFCTGFWLLANRGMGNGHMPFERDAWYSHYWGGQLPVVQALKDLPKTPRTPYVGPPVPPVPPVILTDAQIADVTKGAGFTGDNWTISVAVCLAESGGNPNAVNYNAWNQSMDRGLFQINSPLWDLLLPPADAYNPAKNAAAAFSIWNTGGGWNNWTAYTQKTYLNFWDRAVVVTKIDDENYREFSYWSIQHVPYNKDAALMKAGRKLGGTPISPEGSGTLNGVFTIGQNFLGPIDGIMRVYLLYCPLGQWSDVKMFVLSGNISITSNS